MTFSTKYKYLKIINCAYTICYQYKGRGGWVRGSPTGGGECRKGGVTTTSIRHAQLLLILRNREHTG